jgi:hypothetical protein
MEIFVWSAVPLSKNKSIFVIQKLELTNHFVLDQF